MSNAAASLGSVSRGLSDMFKEDAAQLYVAVQIGINYQLLGRRSYAKPGEE